MHNEPLHAFADRGPRAASDPIKETDDTLLRRFRSYFETVIADTPGRVRTAHQIRHQVYCIENPLEEDNAEGLERDEFDSHSVHSLLIHRATGAALGTVRLILPLHNDVEQSFALQRVMSASALKEFGRLPVRSAAEVSRFSISRQFRRTLEGCGTEEADFIGNAGPLMRLGLIQGLVRMSVQHGITHWCAVMEQTLLRMLAAMAIRFRPIGPPVDFHGLRQPCYCQLSDILEAVRRERPAFWSVLTDGGSLLKGAALA